ncbi:MAG TPA: prephenate dehydratase [Candidatus Binataceae bacterium]|nr:prephenate dehydratase [Candidatus Binataceae bacterium]
MPSRTARKTETEPPSIETLRARMDEISAKLLSLLSLRASVAVEIGRLKHQDGGLVYQPGREREVIDKLVADNPGPLDERMVRRIFGEIVSACRALEQVPRIAFLGPEHTYSHEAAMLHFGQSVEFAPEASFAAAFQAVEGGRADFAVVPVENSTDGSITLTLDLLIDTPLSIIGEIKLPIRQALASRDGERAAIHRIVSHPSSLAQCRGYLAVNFAEVEQEQVASNALATRRAAEEPGVAAIASLSAAQAYGLKVIAHNIQDLANNSTRFLVMGKQPVDRSGKDKTTAIFAVADRVGTLHGALNVFARSAINISKIESRPLRARPWEYLFFVDFAGHRDDPKVKRGLKALERKTLFLKVLGSYPEGRAALS